jgi:ubiquinone/menaquinone biosynthesis C-methylase UbiE
VPDNRDRALVDRYDAHAAAYQELWAPTLRLASLQLLGELTGRQITRVIDVGAGVGALWSDVRSAFPQAWVLGLDRSPGMLRCAPPPMVRAVADARMLPVAGGRVDLVLCLFMLFHLDEPGAAIREARRVLRSGGTVGTITWGSELASTATRLWTECLEEFHAAAPDPGTEVRHGLVDTPDKMDALLHAAGFETVRAWAGELVTTIGLDHLIALKTRMGSEKARFDSLDAATRAACVAHARQRLRALAPGDFTAGATVVYAIAC